MFDMPEKEIVEYENINHYIPKVVGMLIKNFYRKFTYETNKANFIDELKLDSIEHNYSQYIQNEEFLNKLCSFITFQSFNVFVNSCYYEEIVNDSQQAIVISKITIDQLFYLWENSFSKTNAYKNFGDFIILTLSLDLHHRNKAKNHSLIAKLSLCKDISSVYKCLIRSI